VTTVAQPLPVDVRQRLTPDQFRAEYAGRSPVVLRGAAAGLPAVSTWEPGHLAALAPDLRVRLKVGQVSDGHTATVRLADYVRELTAWEARAAGTPDPGEPPGYLHDVPLLSMVPALRADLEPFPAEYFPAFFRDRWWTFTQFFVGPSGALTPLHFDTLLTHNLFFQVHGSKRFVMVDAADREHCYTYNWRWSAVDPDEPDPERFPAFRNATVRTCVVEPGDVLYMPPGTLHKVTSLSTSVSFNIDWHDRGSALRGLAAVRDGMPPRNLRYNLLFALGVLAHVPRSVLMPGLRSYYSYISKPRSGPDLNTFTDLESDVRAYSRRWPVVFDRATGSHLYTEDGAAYLDFFAGAGALNYGHNNPVLKHALIEYIARDGVTHALDMFTTARRELLETLATTILEPRGMDHRVVFPGPGGANAIEAALKLARAVTGRCGIVHFTNAFHGATLGALAVTGSRLHRGSAGVPLTGAISVPYDGFLGDGVPHHQYLERMLATSGSGMDRPAAVIVETVQGEGGLTAAGEDWLRGLADLCREHRILLIVDDVQMGCGRTGPFFSFEDAGIMPDIVCLSKSIGGYGLPLALTLIRPELDVWRPGEHSGTFRGVNPSFVTAVAALRAYWCDDALEKSTRAKGERVANALRAMAESLPGAPPAVRGRGLARGLVVGAESARAVCDAAFARGLLLETAGGDDEVVKILPPLTIAETELDAGLAIIDESVRAVLGGTG
jgi:diaminobutyrate-2-oxoglutarate transaminase